MSLCKFTKIHKNHSLQIQYIESLWYLSNVSLKILSSISDSTIHSLCDELLKNNSIQPEDYKRFDVKKGLRNSDGTGVMAGLTKICSVEGYYIDDGERVPREGRLFYRGINMSDIVKNCKQENRFSIK